MRLTRSSERSSSKEGFFSSSIRYIAKASGARQQARREPEMASTPRPAESAARYVCLRWLAYEETTRQQIPDDVAEGRCATPHKPHNSSMRAAASGNARMAATQTTADKPSEDASAA